MSLSGQVLELVSLNGRGHKKSCVQVTLLVLARNKLEWAFTGSHCETSRGQK